MICVVHSEVSVEGIFAAENTYRRTFLADRGTAIERRIEFSALDLGNGTLYSGVRKGTAWRHVGHISERYQWSFAP